MPSIDTALKDAVYVVDLDGETYVISLVKDYDFYGINILDEKTGKTLEANVFTDEDIPPIYDETDVQSVLQLLFQEVADVPQLSDSAEPDEWHTGRPIGDITDANEATMAITMVNEVVTELFEVTMVDSIKRDGNVVYMKFGSVIARVDFRLAK